MKALVLGGTGIIGNHIVRELLAAGHEVTALARGITPALNLDGLKVKKVIGDLNDATSLERAFRGHDWVFQAAAYYPHNAFQKHLHVKNNQRSLENVIQAALKSGVQRLVYTSSLTTIGSSQTGLADEASSYTLSGKDPHPYFLVKHLSEERLRMAFIKDQLPVVIVNPTGCFGPYELKPRALCLIPQLLKNEVPAYIQHPINIVDTKDVARGHILAAEKGRVGERYILGGHNTNAHELISTICRVGKVTPPQLRVPLVAALTLCYLDEAASWVLKKAPRFPALALRFLQYGQHLSIAKAQTELGYEAHPLDSCFQNAITWYQKIGYC